MPAIDPRKIRWHSRRGALELDLLLMPFSERAFAGLEAAEQRLYESLLACDDQDLQAWLLRGQPPGDPRHAALIEKILAHGAGGRRRAG